MSVDNIWRTMWSWLNWHTERKRDCHQKIHIGLECAYLMSALQPVLGCYVACLTCCCCCWCKCCEILLEVIVAIVYLIINRPYWQINTEHLFDLIQRLQNTSWSLISSNFSFWHQIKWIYAYLTRCFVSISSILLLAIIVIMRMARLLDSCLLFWLTNKQIHGL